MNKKYSFQFRILRYIHDSFTGEFLNIGLALFSQSAPYFQVRLLPKYSRISQTFPGMDGEYYHQYITALQNKFDLLTESVNSQQLTLFPLLPKLMDEILQKILPSDDSAIQFGPTQGGMAIDLETVFNDLYYRLIETYIPSGEKLSRNEQEIWSLFSRPLKTFSILSLLRSTVIQTDNDEIELDHAWKNRRWRALQPISFDLQHPGSIQNKSHLWLGKSLILNESPDIAEIFYLLGKPRRDDPSIQKAYIKAKDVLGSNRFAKKIQVIEEDSAVDFARFIAPKIKSDVEHTEDK